MPNIRWRSYQFDPPIANLPVIFQGSSEDWVERPCNLEPEFNVYGLMWRPTGIYREWEDSLPYEARAQQQVNGWMGGLLGNGASLGSGLEFSSNWMGDNCV